MNTTGKIVVEPIDPASYRYQRLNIIDEQTAFLQQCSGKGRFFDIASNRFYPSASSKCGDKLTTYKTGKGYGVSDIDSRTIIPHQYYSLVFADKDGKYLVARDRKNKYGILASDGSVSLPFEFDNISVYNKNPLPVSIPVEQDGKWFLVSTSTWQRLEDNNHDWIGSISPDGYAIIEEITKHENESRPKYGLIDCYGTVLIPAEYDSMRELGSGRWVYEEFNDVIANVKHGVVDCFNNKNLLEYEYYGTGAFVEDFHNDRYIVSDNRPKRSYHGHIGVVAENGRIILPFRFSSLSRFGDVYRVLDADTGFMGLYSSNGDEILPCVYRYIGIGDTLDFISVWKDNEWYYVNLRGNRVLL